MVPFLIHYRMTNERKRISAFFYRTEAGREPVRDWLKELSKEDRRLIGGDQDSRVRLAYRHADL